LYAETHTGHTGQLFSMKYANRDEDHTTKWFRP